MISLSLFRSIFGADNRPSFSTIAESTVHITLISFGIEPGFFQGFADEGI